MSKQPRKSKTPEAVSLKDTKPIERTERPHEFGVQSLDQSQLQQVLESGEASVQVVSLDPPTAGKVSSISGFYGGPGTPVSINDPAGDEPKPVNTHLFIQGSVRLACMGSYQIDTDLPFYIGRQITLVRGETKPTKSERRVNKFVIIDHSPDAKKWSDRLPALSKHLSDEARKKGLKPRSLEWQEFICDSISDSITEDIPL